MNNIIKNGLMIACIGAVVGAPLAFEKYYDETRDYISNPVFTSGNPRTLYSAEKPNERSFGLHEIGKISEENFEIERFPRRYRFNKPLADITYDGFGNIKKVTLHLQEGDEIPEYCPVGR